MTNAKVYKNPKFATAKKQFFSKYLTGSGDKECNYARNPYDDKGDSIGFN